MSINQLIIQNLKKNLKNYYLYVFALVFSVALYFAFVTLQYDPALDETKGSIKGAASIKVASILLVAIVTVFLLYANNIFIKRRSKEIGLFQLIGMTKGKVFRILSAENFILYFGSLLIGIFVGFSISKFIMMILFKITGVDTVATLRFSTEAFIQTIIVFGFIYLLIMLINYIFVKRQTILSLFQVISTTEDKIKKVSFFQIIIGIVGIGSIASGYFVSTQLFGGAFQTVDELFLAMAFILGSVIIGTYLFYKGSVSFLFHLIRKKKGGYLSVNAALSLSSIMFRMKSNALLLTIITTVSALAIGLLSLSYISYYSAEKSSEEYVPADFAMTTREDADLFMEALQANGIEYRAKTIDVVQADINVEDISLSSNLNNMHEDFNILTVPVISDQAVDGIDLTPEEAVFTGYNDLIQKYMPLKDSGQIELIGSNDVIPLNYSGMKKDFIVSNYFTMGGPVAIVDETTFERLTKDINPDIQKASSVYIGIDISNKAEIEAANDLFQTMDFTDESPHESRLMICNEQKQSMGLIMFIVGFLGLTFLVTSGCILYFKQMDESEEERPNYTILRKLGFTRPDLLKGIRVKQLFSFGIPLVIGLSHSYFAVQSGWFMFGTELWTPMIIVMVLYTALYSIFGFLSVLYYKKVIKESL
ncbi:bacitracin transport system permease protein [Evansella caseinilytica]|uniref:Bacitracin transport system permease protein n=1 Tax=Evansella caseinilytica TaxID=1503961 RepID=A0A1H3RJP4_9BACI|nr:ABC transporter permease [Evansella caseinilytica]SDZ25585.1 bacitracin transport system permease protein [Evansella caseinilytica]